MFEGLQNLDQGMRSTPHLICLCKVKGAELTLHRPNHTGADSPSHLSKRTRLASSPWLLCHNHTGTDSPSHHQQTTTTLSHLSKRLGWLLHPWLLCHNYTGAHSPSHLSKRLGWLLHLGYCVTIIQVLIPLLT